MKILKSYFGYLIAFLLIDALWIIFFAGEFYQQQLASVLKEQPDFTLVAVFYLCYAAGVVYLAVLNADKAHSALIGGAVFGLLAYGTYTITNYSLIEGWSMALVITDVLWGGFVTGVSSLIAFYCMNSGNTIN